ncbi:MAG: ABC transporter ATP-binding protein [Parcubacteria group bacterium]|jgi:ABC-type multidrug transport system fused ATPase/permease subunit
MAISRADFQPIIKYLKPYKKAVRITVAFVILEHVTYLISPLIYGRVVDVVTKGVFFEKMVFILLFAWAAMEILSNWFLRRRVIESNKIGYQISSDLINNSLKHLVNLPLSFHKGQKIGEIVQRFTRADNYLYSLIDQALFSIIPYLITSFLAFAVILWINWILAVVYAAFILIYVTVTIKMTEPVIVYQKKLNKVFEKMYGDIFDRTPNIISIKSNATEELEYQRNLGNTGKGFGLNNMQVAMWMNMGFWQSLIFTIGFLALFSGGIYMVSVNKITIGQFVMLLAYINFVSNAVNMLGSQYKKLQEGLTTIRRSEKIFEEIPEDYDAPKAQFLQDARGEVEFSGVNFSYEKEKVLDGISFKAAAGQMVAIVGKSGEGKSTLVDLISRYNIPQQGKILLDGMDINKIKLKSLRDAIAIVPQEIDLFNDTIKNNIGYSKLGATDEDIVRAARLAHCHEFIAEFPKKYEQVVGEKGVKLSTGQKQRVAIARAILRNPKILILDEATSALDSESEKYVQEALQEVMKNRTTFVIAHRLSTIRKADLILVLEDGKIVESGDHAELLQHGGVYHKLSELQRISV